jgi:hypothetical protein
MACSSAATCVDDRIVRRRNLHIPADASIAATVVCRNILSSTRAMLLPGVTGVLSSFEYVCTPVAVPATTIKLPRRNVDGGWRPRIVIGDRDLCL